MVTSEPMVDDDGVVRIGSVVFALIRPTAGRDRAFNHWYERDHYYTAGTAAPGVFSAGRFIEPADRLHLALYFVLPGHDEARAGFAAEQYRLAEAQDRLFSDREHLHTWSYDVATATSGAGGVAPALALDRRYRSLAVGWGGTDAPMPPVPPGAVAIALRPRARVMPSSWDADIDPMARTMVLVFRDEEADTAADPFSARSGYHWSRRFRPVVFGTDTHVVG